MGIKEEPADQGVRVKRSPAFKLKDKPNRNFTVLKLMDFGFLPEVIIIEKVHGSSNTFVINAVLTKEAMAAEDKLLKKLQVEKQKNGRSINKPASKEAGGKTSAKA